MLLGCEGAIGFWILIDVAREDASNHTQLGSTRNNVLVCIRRDQEVSPRRACTQAAAPPGGRYEAGELGALGVQFAAESPGLLH